MKTLGAFWSGLKNIQALSSSLVFLLIVTGSAKAQSVHLHWTSPVNERVVTFYAEPQGVPPDLMAVVVQNDQPKENANLDPAALIEQVRQSADPQKKMREIQAAQVARLLQQAAAMTNQGAASGPPAGFTGDMSIPDFDHADWVPFKTNLTVDFGRGDGGR